MAARTRQVVVLVLVGAIAALTVRWWSRRGLAVAGDASWPPLVVADDPPTDRTVTAFAAAPAPTPPTPSPDSSAPDARWVLPLADGSCPQGYPVKANDNSGIFHVPGGRFYDRTKPARSYAEADGAAADGYRPPKA